MVVGASLTKAHVGRIAEDRAVLQKLADALNEKSNLEDEWRIVEADPFGGIIGRTVKTIERTYQEELHIHIRRNEVSIDDPGYKLRIASFKPEVNVSADDIASLPDEDLRVIETFEALRSNYSIYGNESFNQVEKEMARKLNTPVLNVDYPYKQGGGWFERDKNEIYISILTEATGNGDGVIYRYFENERMWKISSESYELKLRFYFSGNGKIDENYSTKFNNSMTDELDVILCSDWIIPAVTGNDAPIRDYTENLWKIVHDTYYTHGEPRPGEITYLFLKSLGLN